MNPATAAARVLVDELIRAGVRHVVCCPGSRNAPLSYALHRAALAGELELHVRIDERSAGFLALGISKALGMSTAMGLGAARGFTHEARGLAAVVCTSGTAVANLHPAVLEAHHAGEPLIVLSADRPPELIGTGANQTTTQHGIFGPLVSTVDFPVAERRPGQNAILRGMVCRALADRRGPCHLNLPFREPLVPEDSDDWPEPLDGRPDGAPWTSVQRTQVAGTDAASELLARLGPRTLTLVCDSPWRMAVDAGEVARRMGWPLLVEPPAFAAGEGIQHGTLLLGAATDGLPERLRPDAMVVVGRPTLSRGVQRLLRQAAEVHVVGSQGHWADPQYVASSVLPWLNVDAVNWLEKQGRLESFRDSEWAAAWQSADIAAGDALTGLLADEPWPTGLHVARELVDALPAGAWLLLGSSNPVRDVDLAARRRTDLTVLANRGLAGIDGSVSTAAGTALVTRTLRAASEPSGSQPPDPRGSGAPVYALLGDLTFLHDVGGLLTEPERARPDLTIVVLNDDGGGIFTTLEQGAPEYAASFEQMFGTPHGADIAALCAGYRVPHVAVRDARELRAALAPAPGMRVVEVRVDRTRLRDLHERLRTAVATAALE